MTVPFKYNFEACLINSLRFSEASFFTFHFVFSQKRKPKIFGFKNVIKRGIRKILTFIKGSIASKIFDKITLKPLYFRKASSSPRKTESIQILQRRLDFISRDLRVLCTLDSLKRIYNAFRRKPSLGAPGLRHASFEKKALVRLMRKMSSFSGTSWSTSSVA